jgi:hypothetical protein
MACRRPIIQGQKGSLRLAGYSGRFIEVHFERVAAALECAACVQRLRGCGSFTILPPFSLTLLGESLKIRPMLQKVGAYIRVPKE